MASRERKRAQRRKRKERGAARRDQLAAQRDRVTARSEERNRAARAALEPLHEGERPRIVTAAAVISAVIAVSIAIGWAAGVEVDGERPNVLQVIAPMILMAVMAWGLWRARYWAVLGFQTLLLIVILFAALSLLGASRWQQAIGNTALIVGAGALFYFNVKAMARIQMPQRLPRD